MPPFPTFSPPSTYNQYRAGEPLSFIPREWEKLVGEINRN